MHNGLDLNDYIYSEDKDEYFLFMGKVDWGVKGLLFALKIALFEVDKIKNALGDFTECIFFNSYMKRRIN